MPDEAWEIRRLNQPGVLTCSFCREEYTAVWVRSRATSQWSGRGRTSRYACPDCARAKGWLAALEGAPDA